MGMSCNNRAPYSTSQQSEVNGKYATQPTLLYTCTEEKIKQKIVLLFFLTTTVIQQDEISVLFVLLVNKTNEEHSRMDG